ncbi:hypothetical protein [Tessaracoccus sp. OH4464_COT-324]|uniref:hypothetical protein n=1 Tax=Tessaracoccus sp. OH4464_COT-324 TaxID=2491059 RepID=UPI000F63CBED|nr:hypothetical protein [Tessaracoccus sp. OH4464_COT-324]RRD46174.1 hypothetical protein EII42_08280 [Tessaracoccus sp. OH4464_COT-324]
MSNIEVHYRALQAIGAEVSTAADTLIGTIGDFQELGSGCDPNIPVDVALEAVATSIADNIAEIGKGCADIGQKLRLSGEEYEQVETHNAQLSEKFERRLGC